MEVIGHQAGAEELEGVAFPCLPQGVEESLMVIGIGETIGAIVAPVQDMKDEAVLDRSWKSSHEANLRELGRSGKEKMN